MRGGSGLGWLRGTALDLVERKRLDGPHKDGKITRPRACVAEVLHPIHNDARSAEREREIPAKNAESEAEAGCPKLKLVSCRV